MSKLLIISYDALGDSEFHRLLTYPNFAALAARSVVHRNVPSLFLTNTYPVHTSVVTGRSASEHGLINNTDPFPAQHPHWWYQAHRIKSKTLWQAAAEKGLSVASVMWPVTGGAKEIHFNIPELMAQPGENQVLLNLRYGSKLSQILLFLKYRHLLRGISQPARDKFATACMADILKTKKPDLALMHLTAYDSLCHYHGIGSPQLDIALESLDENLGTLLGAIDEGTSIILFSDHSQLPSQTSILPNKLLHESQLLDIDNDGLYIQNSGKNCFFECCGGSTFFHPGTLTHQEILDIKEKSSAVSGFSRFLTSQEMHVCGRSHLPFGMAALPGFAFHAYEDPDMANHGYPADYDNYNVFYMSCTDGHSAQETSGGSLLDIAPLAAKVLSLDM